MSPTTVNEVLACQNRDQPSVGHINSLPADVLLDIFEQYVRPGPIYPEAACWMGEPPSARAIEYLHDRGKNSPFIIDQVCQTWRQLCRSNSGLYSDIHIVDPKPQDVVRVKTMLKLSKDRPLRVFLQDRQCSHPATQVSVTAGQGTARRDQSEQRSDHLVSWNRILQSVLSTPRIEKLYLTITHEASSQCWRNTWETRETNWLYVSFPLLTTLYVNMNFKQNMVENIFVRDLVSRACATSPRLTDVRFDSIFSLFHLTGGDEVGPNELRPTAKMIPWRNLTSLSMCVRYLGKALTILGQCPLLQTVELYGIRNTMFPDTLIASANGDMTSVQQEQNLVREPVNLPFLWSLFLSMGDTVADTFEPLLYLKAPALKCLTLQRTEQRQTGVIPFEMQRDALLGALTVFHKRNPGCRIQTFTNMQQWCAGDVGYQQILSHPIFQDILWLMVDDVVGEETLEWLTWDRTSTSNNARDLPVLPKLRTLSVRTDAKDGLMSQMVASRVVDVPHPILRVVYAQFTQCLKKVCRQKDRKGSHQLAPLLEWLAYGISKHSECSLCGST